MYTVLSIFGIILDPCIQIGITFNTFAIFNKLSRSNPRNSVNV